LFRIAFFLFRINFFILTQVNYPVSIEMPFNAFFRRFKRLFSICSIVVQLNQKAPQIEDFFYSIFQPAIFQYFISIFGFSIYLLGASNYLLEIAPQQLPVKNFQCRKFCRLLPALTGFSNSARPFRNYQKFP